MVVETRKLQRLGSSSLVVTLPREWIKRMELKPGDVVYLVVEGDTIRITPSNRESSSLRAEAVFKADEVKDRDLVSKAVSCLYILGYDNVLFRLPEDDIALQNAVRMAASRLSGLEASEAMDGNITIRYLLDPSKVEVSTTIRSMGLVVSSLAKLSRKIVEGLEEREAAQSLKLLREELFRNQHMVMRFLVTGVDARRLAKPSNTYSLMIGTSLLGLIGGVLLDISQTLLERRPKHVDVLIQALSVVEELVPVITSLLVSPSLQRSRNALKRIEETLEAVKMRVKNCRDNVETIVLSYIYQALRILFIISNTILCNAIASSKYLEESG